MFLPFPEICVLSDNPIALHRDEQGRLHSDDCAALEYADGWKLFRWHGVTVPERAIADINSYTVKEIFAEQNSEVRWALMSMYGWDRILKDGNGKRINRDQNPVIGELWEFFDAEGPIHILYAQNGTPEAYDATTMQPVYKWYAIPVRPVFRTALDAGMSTYRIPPELQATGVTMTPKLYLELSKHRS
jgi:hypothetical protein